MDPLSIAAAVVGLLTATGKIYALLETISAIKNSPTTIKDAQNEVRHTEIALRSMQRLLERLNVASARRELIQVDELRITLADAMLVFSGFESMLQLLASLSKFRVVISWQRHAKQIDEYLARIDRYKLSLTFMLNILQCESDTEAYRCQEKLHEVLSQVLSENSLLREKLQRSEDSFDARSIATRRPDEDTITVRQRNDPEDDTMTIRGPGLERSNTVQSVVGSFRNGVIKFAFENVLEQSRVYKKSAHFDECDRSFASTAYRSHAWSVFTGYSLADISILSVIAMPLTALDVVNSEYYRAENPEKNKGSHLVEVTPIEFSIKARSNLQGKLCSGCNNISLSPTEGFEICIESGSSKSMQYWHIDCFRCLKCEKHLVRAYMRLLGYGWLSCEYCAYDCAICCQRIKGSLNIVVDNNIFICGECFECRRCKTKLDAEDPQFRRLKDCEILCISCSDTATILERQKPNVEESAADIPSTKWVTTEQAKAAAQEDEWSDEERRTFRD